MDREIEKKIVAIICDMSAKLDYSKSEDIDTAISEASANETFGQSLFGKKFINRLKAMKEGESEGTCILCGEKAPNGVICPDCIGKVEKIQSPRPKSQSALKNNDTGNYIRIEDLLKDMGDDMMQLATQNSVSTLKKLAWVNIGLLIINSIIIIFMVIFLWNFMMAQ